MIIKIFLKKLDLEIEHGGAGDKVPSLYLYWVIMTTEYSLMRRYMGNCKMWYKCFYSLAAEQQNSVNLFLASSSGSSESWFQNLSTKEHLESA